MIRPWLKVWRARLQWKLLLLASVQETIHGVPVLISNTGQFASCDTLLAKTRGALELIATFQPWRLQRMRRDLSRIWIRRQALCRASYWHASRTCVLDTYFVASFTEAEIASSMIHEAVHARIRARGYYPPLESAGREERVCRKAEFWFGRAIPDGSAVTQRAEWNLSLADADLRLTSEQHRDAQRQAFLAELQELSLPRWYKRRVARQRGYPDIAAEL